MTNKWRNIAIAVAVVSVVGVGIGVGYAVWEGSESEVNFVTIVDSQKGVSYVLPEDWHFATEEELRQVPTMLQSAYLGEEGHEYAMIYVTTIPMMAGLSLSDINDNRMEQIGEMIDHSKTAPFSFQSMVVDKHPAFRLDYAYTSDDTSARAIEVWVTKDDLVFMLFSFASSDRFPEYKPIFENVIDSFKFVRE